jgi:hypothetical protein
MVLNDITPCVGNDNIYELVYFKDGNDCFWSISKISYQYNKKCIKAYCLEARKELIFKVENIKSLKMLWCVANNGDRAIANGLYILCWSYRGQCIDTDIELQVLKKDDPIKPSQNIVGIESIVAYHYIPFYDRDKPWTEYRGSKEMYDKLNYSYEHGWYTNAIIAHRKHEGEEFKYDIFSNQNHFYEDFVDSNPEGYYSVNVPLEYLSHYFRSCQERCRF